ncbi:hypothetical protein ACQP2U_00455 [Nocardia sp. CA-084685]|uniref:hypothetical protein n=1 Tax=Nocardia sp. CA-084685 TaxID=3239970 RepID=UPI003D9709C1
MFGKQFEVATTPSSYPGKARAAGWVAHLGQTRQQLPGTPTHRPHPARQPTRHVRRLAARVAAILPSAPPGGAKADTFHVEDLGSGSNGHRRNSPLEQRVRVADRIVG